MTLVEIVMAVGMLGFLVLGVATSMNYFDHDATNTNRTLDARELMRQVRHIINSPRACSANFAGIPISQVAPGSADIPLARFNPQTGMLASDPLIASGKKFGRLIIQNARLVEKLELATDRYTVSYEITLAPDSTHGFGRTTWTEVAPFSVAVGTDGKITECAAASQALEMSDTQASALCINNYGTDATYDPSIKTCILPNPVASPGPTVASSPAPTSAPVPGPEPSVDTRTRHFAPYVNGFSTVMCPATSTGIDYCKANIPSGSPKTSEICGNFLSEDGTSKYYCEQVAHFEVSYIKTGSTGCKCVMSKAYFDYLKDNPDKEEGTKCEARCKTL